MPSQYAVWRELEIKIVLFQNSRANHSKNGPIPRWLRLLLCCLPCLPGASLGATSDSADCKVRSGPNRVALIELYTSEGCSSCPPADRWLGNLSSTMSDPSQIVALAFHIDYWDYLGWHDRFAQPRFSARQRSASRRSGAKFVYTPQVLLNGADSRSSWRAGGFESRVREIGRSAAQANLSLHAQKHERTVNIRLTAAYTGPGEADVFVALTQNKLETRVRAGENAGKTLEHQYVVREFWGPLPIANGVPIDTQLDFVPPEDVLSRNSNVSAFVQHRDTGDVAQALSAAVCEQ